jgi:hypothetical protein
MNTKYLVVVAAAVAVMLMGATALATGNAFAYEEPSSLTSQ